MVRFRQSVVVVFLSAFFALSGTNGLCEFFHFAELTHHHDKVAGDTSVCFSEEELCEDVHVPCSESDEEVLDVYFTASSGFPAAVGCPVVGVAFSPKAMFGRQAENSEPELSVRYELVRGSPINRQITLCRFTV